MAQDVAPWLQGLDEAWEIPTSYVAPPPPTNISSATHDAHSICTSTSTRITRHTSSHKSDSRISSTQRRRNPLATLISSGSNSIRERPNGTAKLPSSRSFSGTSDDSVLYSGTVQHRSKSSSPTKKQQETLEWRRRLLNGKSGYGDQTDLFAPSGLENIFATPRASDSNPEKKSCISWLERDSADSPSSPPQWSSQLNSDMPEELEAAQDDEGDEDERLTAVAEETEHGADNDHACDETYASDPEPKHASQAEKGASRKSSQHPMSSPERLDPTEYNMAGNRTVSGQTDCEDFSPVFISKHTAMNGQVDYRAMDSHLVKKFQNIAFDSKQQSQDVSEQEITCTSETTGAHDASTFTDGTESEISPAAPDLSLSENLPTGTPPSVAGLDGNVEVRRGGYSAQGSFRGRALSPSPSRPESSMSQNASVLLSPVPTANRKVQIQSPAHDPSTPVQEGPSTAKSRSSGSPLKLFGPHDTFTSNRLWRRMSQLDPDLATTQYDDPNSSPPQLERPDIANARKASAHSFGSGDLSHHRFNAEITITSASDSDIADSDGSPGSDVPPPGARSPLMFKLETSPVARDTFKLKRRRSAVTSAGSTMNSTTRTARFQATVEDATDLSKTFEKPAEMTLAMGKRPTNSPYKAPTPKRRRTLHASELEIDGAAIDSSYHENLQNALSSQRRGESGRLEELRDPLRPRNPTPSQRRREQIEAEIREVAEQYATEAPDELEAIMEQIEASVLSDSPPSLQQQARAVANQVAKFSMRVQKASEDMTERKRSVTTQDFFNEAVMVMRLIREKAGRQSGLGGVAESEPESNSMNEERSSQDLSALRVSRPPSRDGGISAWRARTSEHTDVRVISHLRRFQETEETDFIVQSMDSINAENNCIDNYVAIDEHSNIRIKGPKVTVEIDNDGSRPASQRSNMSQSTQLSEVESTGRTLHTASTRKSDNVGTLAPESVAHIIGQQVGNMYYDKDKQQWVKTKTPQKPIYGSFLEPPSNITSDDDPFQEISDLLVDERKEEEIRKASSQSRRLNFLPDNVNHTISASQDFFSQKVESRISSHETVLARPNTSEGNRSRHTYSSSDPSKWTALGSSQQQTVETRATSWSDEGLHRLASQGKLTHQPLAYAAAQAALAQRGRTGSLLRQQLDGDKGFVSLEQRSPAVQDDEVGDSTLNEVNQDSAEVSSHLRDDTFVEPKSPEPEIIRSPKLRRSPNKVQFSSAHRNSTRGVSLCKKTLNSRFMDNDMIEQSELSFVAALPGERMMSVSLSVSRPLSNRQTMAQISEQSSSPIRYDQSHILSDLPDFTVHEVDEDRPSEKALAGRLAKYAAQEVNDRYALAVKDLVKTLTEVKEDEPYWDEMKQLDIHGQGIASLHGLEDFCCRVQEMDVSENKLAYLNGAPQSLRSLYACGNLLSSLTPWAHLTNLQYLDISRNQLDSLKGLECLIHLRELVADDNAITSLDGIMQLDGLLKLRLRRNKLQAVDFGNSYLQRLEELDLCSNIVTAVHKLDALASLTVLKLDDNPMHALDDVREVMPTLKHLAVRSCGLRSLDVTNMPTLHTIYADNNSLGDIVGVQHLKALDMLSMRSQESAIPLTVLAHALHARTIRLSGSPMPALHLPTSLLSLQHLELASTGLQQLPEDFGLKLPNLTSLNLNFNCLRDVRPLLNIQKLEDLSVCGNRFERLRKSVATFSKIATLTKLDMRDNPLTQGHHASLTGTLRGSDAQTSIVCRERSHSADEDEDIICERETAALYMLPAADSSLDRTHYARLDDSTKLRRRVQHLMLGYSCPKLVQLNGIPFAKEDAMVKDGIWERLLELGIMRRSGKIGIRDDEDE